MLVLLPLEVGKRPMNHLGKLSILLWLSGIIGSALSMEHIAVAQDGRTESSQTSAKKNPTLDELLLFFPTKYPEGNWNPSTLKFEDVYFEAEDGTRLHGWYCPCDKPQGVALIAHGNAGHVASRTGWLRYLQRDVRLSVFMFDYRGYGRSEGHPTVEGALQDAKAARNKLRELAAVKDSEMLLMGESLGGAIAVHLAADSPPRALILQSTFASLRSVADVHFPNLSWLVPRDKLASEVQIGKYQGELLQSHGTRDQTIPFTSGEQLFRAAKGPKQFLVIRNADHNNWITAEYKAALEAFVKRVSEAQ